MYVIFLIANNTANLNITYLFHSVISMHFSEGRVYSNGQICSQSKIVNIFEFSRKVIKNTLHTQIMIQERITGRMSIFKQGKNSNI